MQLTRVPASVPVDTESGALRGRRSAIAARPWSDGLRRPGLRGLRFALLLVLAALLLACGRDPQPTASGPVASSEAEGPFRVLAITGEASRDRPALSLRFSEPVQPAQDFSQFIEVRDSNGQPVDGAWVLGDEHRQLRYPYVKAGERFTVTVRPGILSANGEAMEKGLERSVESVDMPPAAGFASQGSVLPSQGTDGLPIATVNVSEVDIEFFRVREADILRFLGQYQGTARRYYWDMGGIQGLADSVYLNRFVIDAAPNERKISHIPVHQIKELAPAGVYFAVLKVTGDFEGEYQTTHFLRSDIGLHLRQHRDRLWIATRSLASGEPLSGVELSIVSRDGKLLASASSSGQGQAEIQHPFSADQMLLARRGEQLSLLPFNQPALDLSEFPIDGHTAADVSIFLWSGRDLYRPGEPLRVSALLRDYDGRPLAGEQPLFATLRQPDGRPYATQQLRTGAAGYYLFERAMSSDVPTGRWKLEVSPDPAGASAVHRYDLRIEEFLPERMKLALESPQARLAPGEALQLSVEGAYLYGAPAGGNRFTGVLSYSVDNNPVEGLKGYVFGDPIDPPAREPVDAIDTALDAEGRLQETLQLEPGKANGPIAVSLLGSLYESGGRPVSRILRRTIWPAEALVGIRPLFDGGELNSGARAGFEILKVKPDGSRVAVRGLDVRLLREERDYIWTYDSNLGWKVDYNQRFVEVGKRAVDLAGEQPARLDFDLDWGGYRLEVKDPETGLLSRYPFTAGWGWDDQNRGLDARPDKVKLALDQSSYKAGDRLTLTVTPPHNGPGLLLVESDRLLHSEAFEARAGSSLRLNVSPEWERHDVYITALVFRPGTARDKITPSRAVGIVHVPVGRAERKVEVELEAPASMRPNEALKVGVKAPALAGREAYVTVSAVDLGILNITRFAVPDAIAFFFGKRRHTIQAYDLYGRIIEALAGERARLKFGGDAALPGIPQTRRPTAKVLTVDLFSGPLQLDAEGRAQVELPVPDFNGALRVSAMAWAGDRYGSASSETLVRAPLVAEVSTPRVMAPGDKATLTLDVQNLSGSAQRLRLRFEADSPIAIGEAERELQLADNGRSTLRFPLTALGDEGVGHFRLKVEAGDVSLERRFELLVRAPFPPERRSRVEQLNGPGTVDLSASTQGLLESTVRSRVSASTQVPLPVARLVGDLLGYPYGCIEQTTSKAYPQVLIDPAAATALGLAPIDAERRRRNVEFAIDRIASMQVDSGHFGFWPGSTHADPLMTPYVVGFLQDAEAAGFTVPAKVMQKALERLRQGLLQGGEVAWDRVWGDPANHVRLAFNAHAGLALARVNQAPLGSLRNVYDNHRDKARGPLPLMRLAVALKLAGDATRASDAAALALGERYARDNQYWGDYYTRLGDRAMALALAVEHGFLADSEKGRVLAIGQEAQASSWISTHDSVALIKLAKAMAGSGGRLEGALLVGGVEEGFRSGGWFSRDLVIEDLRAGSRMRIDSSGSYFLVQDTVGIPIQPPAPSSQGIELRTQWYRHDGSAFSGDTLREGEGLVVHLRVRSSQRMPDALVIDPVAGGLEIENLNLIDAKQLADMVIAGTNLDEWRSWGGNIRHQEYREDRYVAAVSLERGSEVNLYYLVRAVSPGDYLVPSAHAEDMYRPDQRAVAAPPVRRIRVVSADGGGQNEGTRARGHEGK